jgi:uncharacterized protein (TIGR04255 family)
MAGVYRPRHPERTVLYRVLFHYFDRFLAEYEGRFEKECGFFRPIIKEVVERYLDCGSPRCGLPASAVPTVRCGFTSSAFGNILSRRNPLPEYPTLPNAPITEALIDIRIKVKSGFDVNQLQSLHESILYNYPEKKESKNWEGKFELKADGPQVSAGGGQVSGYFFKSADKKQIFQAKVDGFTFNRLKPYETWESFRTEAKRLWQLYSEMVSPEIVRVAVRYINKFNIPFPIKDFNEYLKAAPSVPEGLPQTVTSFFDRIVISNPEIEATAIITKVFEQMVEPSSIPIILDIDAFRLNPDGIEEREAWLLLEKLRDFKNDIFFLSITDKAKELFQ